MLRGDSTEISAFNEQQGALRSNTVNISQHQSTKENVPGQLWATESTQRCDEHQHRAPSSGEGRGITVDLRQVMDDISPPQ